MNCTICKKSFDKNRLCTDSTSICEDCCDENDFRCMKTDCLASQIDVLTSQLADLKERLRWIPLTERLPDRDEKSRYSQVICEVKKDGEILILVFNHEYDCWDDKEGDDFYCSIEEVSHWREIPELEDGE